jgi:glutamate/tyrosine decarboxylase-like PLP-dependent enzyme
MTDDFQARLIKEFKGKAALETARRHAYAYIDGAFERRVFPSDEDLDQSAGFAEPFPAHGVAGDEVVEQLARLGASSTVTSLGGRYFGFVTGGALPAAMGARWLADVWNQNTALYLLSPVSSKLETVVEDWLKTIFNLPQDAVAGFVSGSSVAILTGLAAARERIFRNCGWDLNAKGLRGAPPIRVVAGRQIHGTAVKAVAMLGLGLETIEWVDVDDQGRIRADKVPGIDDRTILLLQAGNVNSGSFDPFEELCARASAAGSWVHVDGAFGQWARASPKFSRLAAGMELASSWSADAHKTLNTPLDCGILLCRDREALGTALQASGSYIAYSEARDGMLYTPEMSRRSRVIELWAALKSLGRSGLEALVDQLHERAVQMASRLRAAGFEVLNDVVFNQVLVACENDALTQATIDRIQKSGECWAGGATWFGRKVIRVSICSWATTPDDVERSARAFGEAYGKARARLAEPVGSRQ